MDNVIVEGQVRKILPTQMHTATVILSHGQGQNTATWTNVVLQALAPHLPHVLWILPQSIERPVPVNQCRLQPSWFDIWHLPPHEDEYDEVSIAESTSIIMELVNTQSQSGLDSNRIVLVGFSQGAALSMMVGLKTLPELGGLVSLSGWIPPRVRDQMIHRELHLPILWCHGTNDKEIPESMGEDAISFMRDTLHIPGGSITYKVYDGLTHTINDAELRDVASWLVDIFG